MSANTGEKKSLPMYQNLLPGCPVADTSSSLLGNGSTLFDPDPWRNAGRSTNWPSLSGGKLLPPSGPLRAQADATQRQKGAGIKPGNESA